MNSEELELSLRTEFESYLKEFLADLKQEVSEFQRNFETEFEKHKSQTDEAVRRLVDRFEKNVEFDQAFNESVVEHLRLARDEGATITAIAIGEAEKLKDESAAAPAEYDKLRDAINEISSKTSQSEILKSLVDHASNFAPRGAFFIVKNEQFVGWRAFGDEASIDDAAVREVRFPMSADTLLADSVSSLSASAGTSGSYADDNLFLNALRFGSPDRMYAVPLVARGRGVAVLYADYGSEGIQLQPEALETLVRVAGLTVELAAAGVQPSAASQPAAAPAITDAPAEDHVEAEPSGDTTSEVAAAETVEAVETEETPAYESSPADEVPSYQAESPVYEEEGFAAPAEAEHETSFTVVEEAVTVEETTGEAEFEAQEPVADVSFASEETHEAVSFEHEPEQAEPVEEAAYFEPVQEQEKEPHFVQPEESFEYVPVEEVSEDFPEVIGESEVQPAGNFAPQAEPAVEVSNGSTAQPAAEPIAEVASAQAERTRYRDRNVDLPIEVPEDERRLHNDARRFARLLVSEIKLYNEQKVTDGRDAGDLYDRLREAIDRSRDMYDKRVQQPVADKFDYFHYELVNSLAEGHDVKLGASYPGSKVPA